MMLGRRGAIAGAAGLAAVAGPARAQDAAAAAPIQALNQAILAAMRAGSARTPFAQRFAAFLPAVDRAFDLQAVLAASVGPRLASLPADQQGQLLDVFRRFTAASYVANFDSYSGERIEVVPGQRTVGQDVVVGTQIIPARGEATPIDYVMRRGAQGWRAVDVLLNGNISQNAVKRSDFRSLVTATSAQPLIESLRRKVSELSGGAVT
jgi:phospholipid transport system substrate-binding protein